MEAGEGESGALAVVVTGAGDGAGEAEGAGRAGAAVTPSEDCWVEEDRMDSEEEDARRRSTSLSPPRSLRRSLSSSLQEDY